MGNRVLNLDLLNAMHCPVWCSDNRGKRYFFNSAWCTLTGNSIEKETDDGYLKAIHPGDIERYQKTYTESINKGAPFQIKFRLRGHDGNYRHIIEYVRPFNAPDCSETGFIANCEDFTTESLFRNIRDKMTDLLLLSDSDNVIQYVNPSHEKVLGYKIEDMVGKKIFDFLHPEDADLMVHLPGNSFNITTHRRMELRARHADGHYIWLEAIGMVLNSNDNLIKNAYIGWEITEKKLAEHDLRENESLLRSITENMLDLVVQTNLKAILEYVSPSIHRVLGYNSEELIGKCAFDYIHPDDLPWVIKTFNSGIGIIANGKEEPSLNNKGEFYLGNAEIRHKEKDNIYYAAAELRCRHSDGGYIYLEVVGTSVFDKKNNQVAFLFGARDISNRRRVEEALRESEERYRNLIELSPFAIGIHRNGIIEYVNNAMLKLLGFSDRSEIMGKNLYNFVHPDYHQLLRERIRKMTIEGKVVPTIEEKFLRSDGTAIELEATTIPYTVQGKTMIQVIMRDITAQKKIEEERLKTSKLESLGLLAGGLAHDFNNLLAAILGNIDMAIMFSKHMDERAVKMLTQAENAILKAKGLSQQLLTFSKGGSPIKKKGSIIELIKELTSFALSGSKSQLECNLPDKLWNLEMDEGQIAQVINNILINSDQAMPEGGKIIVNAENVSIEDDSTHIKEGKYVKITIKDSGTGISEENLSKIFDPYFTTKAKGSGLGLTVAYSIIKNHNGYMNVDSELGAGTSIVIHLPACIDSCAEKRVDIKNETPVGNHKILIMDDEDYIRTLVESMLNYLGYSVSTASDGETALNLYKDAKESGDPYDIVIIDLTIRGGMGGKDAIKRLLEYDKNAKAIVSSGYSNDPLMSNYQEYGFKGVLSKPYKIEDLNDILNRLLKS